MKTARVHASILSDAYPQIWRYVREHDPAIFYYAPNDSDRTLAPAGLPAVTADVIEHLVGPALLYKRRIIVCTHRYSDVPNSQALIVVRLQNR